MVLIGASVTSILVCQWMRPRGLFRVALGTASIYALTGLTFKLLTRCDWISNRWAAYTGWMSVITLYLTMAYIAILCTVTSVLHSYDELQQKANRPRR